MPSPRAYHGTVLLADRRIVCVGGSDGSNVLKTVAVFDFNMADRRIVGVGGRADRGNLLKTVVAFDFNLNARCPRHAVAAIRPRDGGAGRPPHRVRWRV